MDLDKYAEGQLMLIDKPLTWTSFDVVKKLRHVLRVKKIGHSGTLDPLATGLLLIGTGKFTKKLHDLQGQDKTYTGIIGIGKTTPSYDLETDFDSTHSTESVTDIAIENVRKTFLGLISQIPPAHSAVKVGGKRAYKMARNNEEVKIDPREVEIKRFDIVKFEDDEIHFEVDCTKGTYIRSLARDFGAKLGVGGYLKSLQRTRIGGYHIENAEELDKFINRITADESN